MADDRRKAIYINVNVNTIQEGDTKVELTETSFNNSTIDLLNINQQDDGNDTPGSPVVENKEEINQRVDGMNLSPPGHASGGQRKGFTPSDQADNNKPGGNENNEINNADDMVNQESSSTSVRQRGRMVSNQNDGNDTPGSPVVEDKDGITQKVDGMNLSPPSHASGDKMKGFTPSDQADNNKPGGNENNEINNADDMINQESSSTSVNEGNRLNDPEKIRLFEKDLIVKLSPEESSKTGSVSNSKQDLVNEDNYRKIHERHLVYGRRITYLNMINICVLVCLVASVFDDIGMERGKQAQASDFLRLKLLIEGKRQNQKLESLRRELSEHTNKKNICEGKLDILLKQNLTLTSSPRNPLIKGKGREQCKSSLINLIEGTSKKNTCERRIDGIKITRTNLEGKKDNTESDRSDDIKTPSIKDSDNEPSNQVQIHRFYWELIVGCLMGSVTSFICYCIGLRKGRREEKEYLQQQWKKEKEISDRKTTAENRARRFQSFRIGLITVQAATLCGESKYQEAELQLEKLTNIPLEDVEVSALLLKAEVLIELEKKDETKKVMNDIVRLFMETLDVNKILNLFRNIIDNKLYVRALVLPRISSDIFKLHPTLSPDDKVKKIRDCVSKINDVITLMIHADERLKNVALNFGLPSMIEMFHNLLAVENVDKPDTKALHAARCVYWIVIRCYFADEYEQSIEMYKSGIDIMERQFDVNASKYEIYGDLLYWLGKANIHLDRYSDAEDNLKKAIDAYSNASDFNSEGFKRCQIKDAKNRLEEVLEKLRANPTF